MTASPQTILNQDGLDLRQGCHDIAIENITGYTGDDLVALTDIVGKGQPAGSTNSTMVSARNNRGDGADDIRYITLAQRAGLLRGRAPYRPVSECQRAEDPRCDA